MHKKPPELDGDVDLKGFEAWQRKYMDYYVLSGMEKVSRQIQLANLRSYLSSDMADKLRFAMAVGDDSDKSVQEVLKVIKEFLRSMRNVTLDRVEFEQRQQLEGEDFNSFFVAIQKIALNAE